jgi:hypothetical protein
VLTCVAASLFACGGIAESGPGQAGPSKGLSGDQLNERCVDLCEGCAAPGEYEDCDDSCSDLVVQTQATNCERALDDLLICVEGANVCEVTPDSDCQRPGARFAACLSELDRPPSLPDIPDLPQSSIDLCLAVCEKDVACSGVRLACSSESCEEFAGLVSEMSCERPYMALLNCHLDEVCEAGSACANLELDLRNCFAVSR